MAKCIMFKQAYKLGEDIIGIMDFSEETVPCVQVCIPQDSQHLRLKVGDSCFIYFFSFVGRVFISLD